MPHLMAEGVLMDDQLPQMPGGPWGGLAMLGTAAAAAIVWLQRFLRKESVDRSADGATRNTIDMLNEQIKIANDRANSERDRADKLLAVLDTANTQISQLRTQVSELSDQVRQLQGQVKALSGGAAP